MTTRIPPTVLSEILESRLSLETIAALLNETEKKHSRLPKHANAKRLYPFWKVCQNCNMPFMALTKEQALRNKVCGKACSNAFCSKPRPHTHKPLPICQVCKLPFKPKLLGVEPEVDPVFPFEGLLAAVIFVVVGDAQGNAPG